MPEVTTWLDQNGGAVTAISTLLGLAIAPVYARVTLGLWQETKRRADLAQQVFEASHRPYVSLTVQWDQSVVGVDLLFFETVFENHGAVPAVISKWDVRASRPDRGIGETGGSQGGLCVFPNRTLALPVKFEGDGIWPSSLPIRIEASVEYRGAGERTYRTTLATQIANGRFEDGPRQEIS